MNKLFTKVVGLCLGLTMAVGVGTAVAFNGVHKEAVEAMAATTWTRITSVNDLVSGTYIIGYESTAGSGTLIPLRSDSASATTTANGFFYTGTTSGSSGSGTISMSTIGDSGSAYEVTVTLISGSVINIQNKDGNYYGATSGGTTSNKARLYTSGNSSETNLTVTLSDGKFCLTAGVSGQYKYMKYNTGSPRYAFYNSSAYDTSFYKKESGSSKTLTSISVSGAMTNTEYTTNDSWDPTGLVVTAHYDDSSEATVTGSASWTFSPATPTLGVTSVTATATYQEKTANSAAQSVTVSEPDLGLYDFEKNFSTYASSWGGYDDHTGLDGIVDIGGGYAATIDLYKASKQSGTITTMPVFATKTGAGSWYNIINFTLNEPNKEIDSVSVTFAQWSSKKPDVALFKGSSASGTPLDTATIGDKNTISTSSSLGGTEFSVGYCDKNTSSNIQSGLKSIVITIKDAEAFGTLDHIKVVSAPDKTTYHVGQTFDTTGLSVKAYDGADEMTAHSKDVTESVTLSVTNGHEFVEADKSVSSVTVSYSESSISDTDTFGISVYGTKVYDKVTSISEGNFIIVDSDGSSGLVTLAGYCNPLDQTGGKNAYAVSDSSGSITAGEEFEVSIASAGEANKYSIQLKNGKYLTSPTTSGTSGIDVSDTAVALTLTFDTDHFVLQGRNSKYFGFDSTSGQERFRFNKTAAGSTLQLYKEHQDTPEQHFELGGVMANNELYYDDYGVLTIGFKDPSQESLYPIVMASVVEIDAPVALDGEDKAYEYITDDISGASATFTLSVYAYSSDYSSYLNEDIVVTIIKPAALVDAVDYAAAYLNAICDSGEMSSTDWAEAKDAYETILESDSQAYLLSADYTYESEGGVIVPTAKVGTHSTIAKAMYQYDYCLKKYSYENFMSRTPVYNIGYNANPFFAVSGDNSSIAIIVVVSLLSVTAIGGYFFIRRRKEN